MGAAPTLRHRIRAAKGSGTVEVKITRGIAIKAFCTECLGFETHPTDCTVTLCPLYPYRGKSMVAYQPSDEI